MGFYPPGTATPSASSGQSLPPTDWKPRQKQQTAGSSADEPTSNELVCDLLKICNAASAIQRGDLVWLGHNLPDKDRQKQLLVVITFRAQHSLDPTVRRQ